MTNGEAAGRIGAEDAAPATPPAEAVRAALARVVASPDFANAPRLQRFLGHVVEAALDGRTADLHAYPIAVDVFDRPADFDPQADSLVRVEAGRLRQKLAAYYSGSGKDDPLRISLPKGRYAPRFSLQPSAPPTAPIPSSLSALAAQKLGGWRVRAALGLGLVLVIAIGGALAHSWRTAAEADLRPAPAAVVRQLAPALAVLPFQALDPAPATTRLTATVASGLTALITADLVRFRQFFVLAGRSAAALALTDGDPIASALEGGLDYVVDGTVRREAEDFVVTASLIATRDGQAVWTETFREKAAGSDVLALEARIARAIVTALAQPYGVLNRQLSRAADRAALPESLASYACILAADRYYASYAMADYAAARDCLEATVAAEPDYAHAWAYLAYLELDRLRYGYARDPSGRELEDAAAAAKRAVALEPENALAQRAMAAVLFTQRDIEGFLRHAERALELNPNDSDALADLGGKLAYAGEWERGLAMRQRAMRLNPAHPDSYHIPFVFDAYRRGDDAAAMAVLERIDLPDFLMTRLLRAAVLGRLGPPEAAAEAVDELLALEPEAASLAGDYFGYWNLPPELIEDLLDGLARAGLTVG